MSSDPATVSDIASYLRQNPGQQVGVDGSIDPKNTDLSNPRVTAVRKAVLQAGGPSYKIQTGAFDNPDLQRDRHAEVLVRSRWSASHAVVPGLERQLRSGPCRTYHRGTRVTSRSFEGAQTQSAMCRLAAGRCRVHLAGRPQDDSWGARVMTTTSTVISMACRHATALPHIALGVLIRGRLAFAELIEMPQ